MQYGRQWFASGVLRDGRVFAIGGEYSTDPAATSDAWSGDVFDPQANAWTPISKPAAFEFVRGDCNGSILADGRVLLGGASVPDGTEYYPVNPVLLAGKFTWQCFSCSCQPASCCSARKTARSSSTRLTRPPARRTRRGSRPTSPWTPT